VKIAPEYNGPVVHVLDASRAVDVVSNLLGAGKPAFDRANRAEQAEIREKYASRREKPLLSYEQARANRLQIDWDEHEIVSPWFLGRRFLDDLPLREISRFIDWTFFFSAWELKGRFPSILEHPQYGPAARDLYDNARRLLDQIIKDGSLQARGVYGFWPAASESDDIVVYQANDRHHELVRFNMLRQQEPVADGKPNLSLADFVAESNTADDYVGAFAVTAGLGTDSLVHRFERSHDDYNAIMVKALADRLAEAFAASLHATARTQWGGAGGETPEDIVAERHAGIRPGFGYPACPDHSEKFKLFDLLEARAIGMDLTEHAAMIPAASVSGLYLAHPRARYFTVGRIGADQVAKYAQRKGQSAESVERWLTSLLGYEPLRC
jgi:5-methyltetrahydrofolate--homocysteine methyltransferase